MSRMHPRGRRAEFGTGWSTGRHATRPDVDVRAWSTLSLLGALAIIPVHFAGRSATGQLLFLIAALGATLICLGEAFLRGRQLERVPFSISIWWMLGFGVVLIQVAPLSSDWLTSLSPRTWETVQNVEHVPKLASTWKTLSLEPSGSLLGLSTFCGYSLIFWTAWQILQTPRDFQRVTCGVGFILAAYALQAVAQLFLPNGRYLWLWQHGQASPDVYLCGPFSNRNHFAQFLILGVGPLLWLGLREVFAPVTPVEGNSRFRRLRTHGALALGLAAWLLIVALATASRGGALAAGCALATAVLLMGLSRLISAGTMAALAIVVIGGGSALTQSSIGRTLTARFLNSETMSRFTVWQANWDVWQDFFWFGTGIGTHADAHLLKMAVRRPDHIFTHAESGYLQVASETGVCGLVVLGGFLMTVLGRTGWAWFRQRSPAGRMAAAGLLTAFAGHLPHAAADFFWYTPACMAVVTVWGAAACRLAGYREEEWHGATGLVNSSVPISKLRYALTTIVLIGLAGWGIDQRIPAWRAEAARENYLRLVHHQEESLTEVAAASAEEIDIDDPAEIEQQKLALLLEAAKADPGNAALREALAAAHVKLYDTLQRKADDGWTLTRIRQHLAENFDGPPSRRAKQLQESAGPTAAHLLAARRHSLTCVSRAPLKANSWLQLARLSCLEDDSAAVAEERRQQAKLIRPLDGRVELERGLDQLIAGNPLGALETWETACELTPPLRGQIIDLLGPKMPATILIERYHLALDDLIYLYQKMLQWKRENQLPIVREAVVRHLVERQTSGEELSERESEILGRTLFDLGRLAEAADQTAAALEANPQSFAIKQIRAQILFEQGQFAESAELYRWCLSRKPDDAQLERRAKAAIDATLRVTGNSASPTVR